MNQKSSAKSGAERAKLHRQRHKPVDVELKNISILDRLMDVVPPKGGTRWTRTSVLRLVIDDAAAKYLTNTCPVTNNAPPLPCDPTPASKVVPCDERTVLTGQRPSLTQPQCFDGGKMWIDESSVWVEFAHADIRRHWLKTRGYAYRDGLRRWQWSWAATGRSNPFLEIKALVEYFSRPAEALRPTPSQTSSEPQPAPQSPS